MSVRAAAWSSDIDSITSDFAQAFGKLSPVQLNWKPNTQTWSIAQCIDHLIVINKTYFPVITRLKRGDYKLPFVARFGFIVNFFGKFILDSVEPGRKKKMKTFPLWEPQTGNIDGNIVAQFAAHQEELKQLVDSCARMVENGTVISSPANKIIVYKLAAAFDIIIMHERRHFNQAMEIWMLQKSS